jgi:hypothetical protein
MAKKQSGTVTFAGVLFFVAGLWNAMVGLVALVVEGNRSITEGDLPIRDLTAWGVVLLVLGAIEALIGLGILARNAVARIMGIAIATIGALVHLAFHQGNPGWAFTLLAIDVLIIYVLTVHGDEFD